MGQRGPKPLPANVHLMRGNASKKPLASLLDDIVRPDVEIPDCPDHLEGEARSEWDRITPHLVKLGLISQIDRAALAAYCDTWGEYVNACACIKAMREHFGVTGNLVADGQVKRLRKKSSLPDVVLTWFAGRVATTPSGYQQISIPVQHRNKSLEQMRSFLAMFGMSPADRSRVTQSDPQLGLPGLEKPEAGGWAEF